MSRFYVTTPIYYVNDKPHLGHAYTTLCADVLARWHRQRGDEVFFLTGTDEHGVKVEQSARAAGVAPAVFAARNAQTFRDAWAALGVSYDYFIRTSDPQHEEVARQLLQRVYDAGYIYPGEYEGLYCVGCEKFITEGEAVRGRCELHPSQELVRQREKNYFFKLSAFRDRLLRALEAEEYRVVPAARRNEVVGKLKQGLDDLSISRQSVEWGVRVPWDESQTIYVWIEALMNYYSATRFVPGRGAFWPADVHLLAKDILWFHAVIWEALLMAAGLPLPKTIATHGFFTIEGQKMSKSLGNVIDPNDLVRAFGAEATRYLLLSQVPFTSDGDVSLARFRERYDSDLANGLGNTFSRVTTMAEKYGFGHPGAGLRDLEGNIARAIESLSFDSALGEINGALREVDRQVDTAQPWVMARGGRAAEVRQLVGDWVGCLRQIARHLEPFMPETARAIQAALGAARITKAVPIFPRLPS